MNDVEAGQVLWLKIRFNNHGDTATSPHPYLAVGIEPFMGTTEIAQLDSVAGKGHKVFFRSNQIVICDNPRETVISRDSFVQLDNSFKVESCPELGRFRRTQDKLSEKKLEAVLLAYHAYHQQYEIDENKTVYMDRDEVLGLNPEID